MPPVGYRAQVAKALPGTALEITKKSGVMRATVERWTRLLRSENLCHIGGWQRTVGKQGAFKPVYYAGPGEDLPCPFVRLEQKEYSARHRARIKKDGREEIRARKQTAMYYFRKARSGRMKDDMVAALFGRNNNENKPETSHEITR